MATIAEAFIIKLGLDAKDVKKGGQEVEKDLKGVENQANKTGKQLEKTGKQGKEFFTALISGVTALAAAVGAARIVSSFFEDAIKGMASLGRSASYVGLSAKELAGWQGAVESVGGSAQEATSSLSGLLQGIINFKRTGDAGFVPELNFLRLDFRKYSSDAKGAANLALDIGEKLKAFSAPEALYFGKKFGFSESFITLIRQGKASAADIVAQFQRASAATEDNVKNAQSLQGKWELFKKSIGGTWIGIESKLTPSLIRLLDKLAALFDKNKDKIADFIQKIIDLVDKLVDKFDFDKMVKSIGNVTDVLGGWKNILIGFGALLTLNLLKPVTGIVGMLGRMVPLLLSGRGGLLGLAAAVGVLIGTGINKAIEGTQVGDIVGEAVTRIAAAFGDKDAQEALERNLYTQGSAEDQGKLKANYLMMSQKEKAQYEKEHPGLSSAIKAGITAQRAEQAIESVSADTAFWASHSHLMGDPKVMIRALEMQEGLPKGMLQGVFEQESSSGKNLLGPITKSGERARGPFQLMPASAEEGGLSGDEVFDLDKSAAVAARKLKKNLAMFHNDAALALAAYNAGEGNVQKYGGIPPFAETQKYVPAILARMGTVSNQSTSSIDNTKSSEVNIGTLQVNAPQATDARSIASELPAAIRRNSLVAQASLATQ